jgi:hypothetical protein
MKKICIIFAILISTISCTPIITHLQITTATISPIHDVESIEDQARAAEAREKKRVQLMIYNPFNTNIDGSVPLSDSVAIITKNKFNWPSESEMIILSNKLAEHISAGRPNEYPLALREAIIVREFPPKQGSKQFTMDSYQKCFTNYLGITLLSEVELLEECEYSKFDLEKSLNTYYSGKGNGNICDGVKNSIIDELWIWVMPGAMANRAYFSSILQICDSTNIRFSIFVFDYGHSVNNLQESVDGREKFDTTPYFIPENNNSQ